MLPRTATDLGAEWEPPALDGGGAERLLAPGPVRRLLAALRHHSLDRRLAAGGDPADSALLAARAATLTRRRTRVGLARALERLGRSPEESFGAALVVPHRTAIRANRSELWALASELRRGPVYARGVAQLGLLLGDGAGAIYIDRVGDALALELRRIAGALRG